MTRSVTEMATSVTVRPVSSLTRLRTCSRTALVTSGTDAGQRTLIDRSRTTIEPSTSAEAFGSAVRLVCACPESGGAGYRAAQDPGRCRAGIGDLDRGLGGHLLHDPVVDADHAQLGAPGRGSRARRSAGAVPAVIGRRAGATGTG